MPWLILGLVLFMGVHSVRLVSERWRTERIAALGLQSWKIGYSIVAALGLGLIIYGYGAARLAPVVLWSPAAWTRPLAAVLMLLSFVLLAAAYVPRNRIKAALGHPMVAGVKLWAFAHLIANGTLADLLMFGSFLAWAVWDFAGARRRDRHTGATHPAGTLGGDVVALAVGALLWVAFVLALHERLIGVSTY